MFGAQLYTTLLKKRSTTSFVPPHLNLVDFGPRCAKFGPVSTLQAKFGLECGRCLSPPLESNSRRSWLTSGNILVDPVPNWPSLAASVPALGTFGQISTGFGPIPAEV